MNTTIPNETESYITGGKLGGKKNLTAKKHKKGNKVLAAWRDHVKVVAKAEGLSYGKEAMQMAKKGIHGKEWAKIKASLHGGAPNDEESLVEDSNVDEVDLPKEEVEDSNVNEVDLPKEVVEQKEEEPVAEELNASDNSLPDAGTADQVSYGGKRRRSSRKNKGKKSRKSKKHRKSRKSRKN
jgi:hypothetical protein